MMPPGTKTDLSTARVQSVMRSLHYALVKQISGEWLQRFASDCRVRLSTVKPNRRRRQSALGEIVEGGRLRVGVLESKVRESFQHKKQKAAVRGAFSPE